jgi:hypothetical protein
VGKAAGWMAIYLVTCACTCYGTTFAPPVLGASAGVPAARRVGGGEVRLGGGFALTGSCGTPATGLGMGQISVAVAPWLDLDAGVWGASVPNLNSSQGQDGEGAGIVLGNAGVRLHLPYSGVWRGSLSAGAGIGCGGAHGGAEYLAGGCGSGATGSLAGGGYLGVDLAIQPGRYVGLFINNRFQVTAARFLPTTFWGAHSFGIQFGSVVAFAVEVGPAYLYNAEDSRVGFFGFASLAIRWGLEDPADEGLEAGAAN